MKIKSTSKTLLLAPALLCVLCVPSHAATVFSAFFNNGTGAAGDKTLAVYNWNAAAGTSAAAVTATANAAVSQGVTSPAVPVVTGASTTAGFAFVLPSTTAGVSMLYTTHTNTSDSLQDQPQGNWHRSGTITLSTLTLGEINQLSVYASVPATSTVMRFAIRADNVWYASTSSFTVGTANTYTPFTLSNLTSANAWYAGAFAPGTSLDDDLSNNTLTTLTSSAAISGYGWYADTGTTSGNDQRVRIDSFQINAIPEPGSALLGGLGLLAVLRRRRPASQP